jgi:hypothetical protein
VKGASRTDENLQTRRLAHRGDAIFWWMRFAYPPYPVATSRINGTQQAHSTSSTTCSAPARIHFAITRSIRSGSMGLAI